LDLLATDGFAWAISQAKLVSNDEDVIGRLPKAVPRHPIAGEVGEVGYPFIDQRPVTVAGERMGIGEESIKHSRTSKG
jgi:hypothetical protein